MTMTAGKLCVALFAFACSLPLPHPARAQGSRSDYERAGKLREMTEGKVLNERIDVHWFAGGDRLWYRRDLAGGGREFIVVDAVERSRKPAFDHERMAKALSETLGKPCTARELPVERIEFLEGENALRLAAEEGRGLRCDLETYALTPADAPAAPERRDRGRGRGRFRQPRERSPQRSEKSPDGKWEVFARGHDIALRRLESGEELPLTSDGAEGDGYDARVFWAPDSQRFIAIRTKEAPEREIHFIESSPKDQLQPKLHSMPYRKPGDDLPLCRLSLCLVDGPRQIPLDTALFPTPWDLGEYRWEPDSGRFTFLYNQRGHQVLRIIAVDGSTGETRAIVDEESKTFIDYAGKRFSHYLEEAREIIWMSERDGWNHLYLYDANSGQVKNQITRGEWVVRGVDRVDEEKREIWFRAGGIYPDQDPYHIHHCRIRFDGSGLLILTEGDGTHSVEPSPDGRFFIDTYSRVDLPPVVELRRFDDGKLVCGLEKADWTALIATGWRVPERFVAKGRDEATDIHGVIYRPTTFDPAKKHPVIEQIYAGPQDSFVPKRFSSYHYPQSMAELGFITVQIDGMGTSNRSKAFHDVCWKNLGDSGFPDRIRWLKAAAEKYPYIDLDRVGIYGGSAGGQSATRALLAHGDFYKVAVSDCGCHDNRMDKIWWNELWMGWPIGSHYAEQSNVTCAHQLQGKLLLFVGELDRNVDPASTLQVVNALIAADKDFDLVVMTG
ncbi:MAG: DPP IV N-terminal domain-containing protein, partial [Planctomycetes bacterium]|nr:DPP IV N-terminal domain-containing protein [Planctomycetota bacterium]